MFRTLALLALAGLIAGPAVGQVATPGDKKDDDKKAEEVKKWTGFWMTKHATNEEVWKISEKDGKWAVEGAIVTNKSTPTGIFYASEVKMENGLLTFIRDWSKKPPGDYEDGAKISALLGTDNLQFTVKNSKGNHKHTMVKLAQAPVLVPQEAYLIGVWKAHVDGMDEALTITNVKGQWVVQMVYYKNGVPWGSAVGLNAGVNAEGKLIFQQKYLKKPHNNYADGSMITASTKGNGKLHYHWQTPSGGTGGRDFTQVPGTGVVVAKPPFENPKTNPDPPDPNPNPNPNPNPTPSTDAFVGSFSGDVDGYKEVWAISNEGGRWAVKGLFYKNDAPAGGFEGKDVTVKDGKLTFTQEYTQKPGGVTWFNGAMITVSPGANGGLSYTWSVGAVTGPARTLTKGR